MATRTFKEEINKAKKKQKASIREQLKKFDKQHSSNAFVNEQKHDEDILEMYSKLSPTQRAQFDKELEYKKLRENFASYVKHVHPNYVLTNFHALICNIMQMVVEKVENGELVRLCLSVPPQCGKLIENNTPVLTRNGWKKHGDLIVGDEVINHKGDFVKVEHVFPKYFANCKVVLTNGEEILCHENHEWLVYDRFVHKEIVRETKFIENTYNENNLVGRGHRYRYQLPIRNFIKGKEKELYVNPYVLGVWLGDGKNNGGSICACEKDRITIDECRKYYPNGAEWKHKTTNVNYASLIGLKTDLQNYGLCDHKKRVEKHIPQEYLTASIEQRLELLAGLIDTDGNLDRKQNRYIFTTSDFSLKETFEELIATFGWRTTTCKVEPKVSTSGIVGKKPYYVIAFNPTCSIPCRIPRKQIYKFSKQRKISICKIERIEPLEGNCIQVQGGIYLVGKTMIPTHNAYTVTETTPSWFLGRNPDMRCILTGYNADMAERFGNENRQLVKKYGKDIFGISISDSQDNKTLWKLDNHEGGLYSAGILGGVTGNPGSLIIVDDPYRNEEDMNNNEKIWRTFTSSIITRASGKGNAIIVIHTRWNDDDLIGRLVKLGWAYINVPAIWEKGEDKLLHRKIGETICPEIGKDAAFMEMQRKTMGERQFSALYQGKPYIDSGNYIKRDNIKFYDAKSKPSNFEELTLSCDLTFGEVKKSSDPYCMTLWGRNGADHYLLKIWDKKANFTDTIRTLRVICTENPQLRRKIVEKKANGKATYDMLNTEIGGFVLFDPKNDSKETRLNSVTPYFESGNVHFPDETLCENIEEFVEQLLKFPACEHDDFVDTISQYLLNYEYRCDGRVTTDSRYAMLSKAIRGF